MDEDQLLDEGYVCENKSVTLVRRSYDRTVNDRGRKVLELFEHWGCLY